MGPLVSIVIDFFRGIAAFTAAPNGASLELSGPNGVGKSSVTDAIAWALGEDVDGEVIRNGSDKAVVAVTFAGYEVRRSKTRTGKPSLTVKHNGDTKAKPAELLAGLRGSIGRRQFTALDSAAQLALVKRIAPGLDTSDLDSKRARLYEERTAIGHVGKALGEPAPIVAEMTAEEIGTERPIVDAVDVGDLAQRRSDMGQAKTENERVRQTARDAEAASNRAHAAEREQEFAVERLTKELAEAQERLQVLADARAGFARTYITKREIVAALVDPDTTALDAEIAGARQKNAEHRAAIESHNRAVRAAQQRADEIARANAASRATAAKIEAERAKYAAHTRQIEAIDSERLQRIASAASAVPVEGLTITEGRVYLDCGKDGNVEARVGILNDAACISLDVAMAAAQGHRLVTIRNAERLDEKHRAEVDAFAVQRGIQVLYEVVSKSGELTAEIVDAAHEELF